MNARRRKFIAAYLKESNATKAALVAGYSKKTAYSIGHRLLSEPEILKAIGMKLDKVDITAERVLRELSLLAYSNTLDYVTINDEGLCDVDFSKLTRDQAAAIQEIKVDTTGGTGDGERRVVLRTTFKLADKGQNLERLGKHLKLFTDVIRHEGLESLAGTLGEKE